MHNQTGPVGHSVNHQPSASRGIVINIYGGRNQILPEVRQVVQYFHVNAPEELSACGFPQADAEEKSEDPEDDAEKRRLRRVALGTLQIYYANEKELKAFIGRIADCSRASELANLVVYEMGKRSILSHALVVEKSFINALQQFITFSDGSTTGNIRSQINKALRR